MSFSTMRMAITNWVPVAVNQEIKAEINRPEKLGVSKTQTCMPLEDNETSNRIIKKILWIQNAYFSLIDEINAWEAASETIKGASELDSAAFLYHKFRVSLIKIKKRERKKSLSYITQSKLR